jgi:hypothetical protein
VTTWGPGGPGILHPLRQPPSRRLLHPLRQPPSRRPPEAAPLSQTGSPRGGSGKGIHSQKSSIWRLYIVNILGKGLLRIWGRGNEVESVPVHIMLISHNMSVCMYILYIYEVGGVCACVYHVDWSTYVCMYILNIYEVSGGVYIMLISHNMSVCI